MKTYRKYGLCIIRNGRLLVTEEVDSDSYLLPGGRPEANEAPEETLKRELKEELSVGLDTDSLVYLGAYEDVAAGEPDAVVRIELYSGGFRGEPQPCAEVKRLVWFAASDDWSRLSPVSRNKILPDLLRRGLLNDNASS